MGNQLTGIAPSQILAVEHYLTDVTDYKYDTSLGSTRFFKVARAKCKEGYAVVKVFVIHDPSLPLATHKDQLEVINRLLQGSSNCLPFQQASVSDKAALLFRQYVKYSLYDRISTRPFLNLIEKKWIAFQLFCALNQSHRLEVCHGDIKSENVMVTSWNWVLLTDFASFKPTYLPEDNPSDFGYFFDTSRRRTCYIAPERFVESSFVESQKDTDIDLTTMSQVKKGKLKPGMDVFSLGCVIAELFTEGTPPFDLPMLLAYRSGEYTPDKVIDKIDDKDIRELVRHMLQKDPLQRKTVDEYMTGEQNRAFPDYFYTFLKLYMQRFATSPIMTPDDRINRIKRDLSLIMEKLHIDPEDQSKNTVLVIIISLVTASLRSLKFMQSKLMVLEVMLQLSKHVTSDITLERLLPYMLVLVTDPYPSVRAEAIATITQCLAGINSVPTSDANIFPEYILPQMAHLTQDSVCMVRVAYAENIALLAETALRFLEMVQLSSNSTKELHDVSDEDSSQYKVSYDTELQALHEMIQQKVSTLLSDPDNIVKQTLLQSGITRLCVFFGRQKANDVLLSHMITFLNDKNDWHLRGAFFDCIVGIAAYVGWQSSTILTPLLQQGLSDSEEFVIQKTLAAVASLTELGLVQKSVLHEMLAEIVPFLCHPNTWIRHGAVGVVSAVARTLNIADVHCNLLPLIQPTLKHKIIQLDQEIVLLNALQPPISRAVFDYISKSQHIEKFFESLLDRQLLRSLCRPGHQPQYSDEDETLTPMFRKLTHQGMTPADEDKLLKLKDFMLKSQASKTGYAEPGLQRSEGIDLSRFGKPLHRVADLTKPIDNKNDGSHTYTKKSSRRKGAESPTNLMNEDWKQMFGSNVHDTKGGTTTKSKQSSPQPPPPAIKQSSPQRATQTQNQLNTSQQTDQHKVIQARVAYCKSELEKLTFKKTQQYMIDMSAKDILDHATWETKPPPSSWKPKGLLVAHLHEHRAAVNRIRVSEDHSFFATCSRDGSVKIFECSRMEGKSFTNRSKQTYNKQGGQIKTITFCESSQSIASASDSGSIHVFRIESHGPKFSIIHTKNTEIDEEGSITDMTYYDSGTQNVLVYTTVHGFIIGWDLRSNREVFRLQNDPKHGVITTCEMHPMQSWMALGTSNGTHICWDMRFHLPITTVTHPTNARVRRVLTHPSEQSWIISSVQGNNEISMWNLETNSRQCTLWASSAPALSTTQATSHSVNGMYLGKNDNHNFLLTAGSDMRIRYWDLNNPANSRIIVSGANDPDHATVPSYRSRIIDGTEVIQETYNKIKPSASDEAPRRGPDTPPSGHHDSISDINVCQPSQCFIITASRDGIVKVWK